MATTKVRAKTPMKNKNKFWRRVATKQYDGTVEHRNGRQIASMMRNSMSMKGMALPVHIKLLRLAGISTPVFDSQEAARYTNNVVENTSNVIQDAEIINEGAV
jgi:hypothetical protein